MMRRIVAASSVILTVAVLRGQQPSTAPARSPDFQAEVNYVQVAVRVIDKSGEFVRGLTQSDFRILEDGQSQTIATFQMVDVPVTNGRPPAADARPAADGLEISTERAETEGRVYAVVIDDLFLEANYTLKLRNVLRRFVTERIGQSDLAGVFLTSGSTIQNLTQDKQLVIDAIDRATGAFDPVFDVKSVKVLTIRIRATINDELSRLADIQGRRKALLLVTPSHPWCEVVVDAAGRVRDDEYPTTCRAIFDSAVRAGVTIYTLDPRGPAPIQRETAEWNREPGRGAFGTRGVDRVYRDVRDASAAWISLAGGGIAEQTGGFSVRRTNGFDEFFDRLVEEQSTYYLIGYYSTNDRADGKFRKHTVKTTARDVRLVHRAGYFAPRRSDRRP